jgi:hypothetical protein
VDPSMSVNKKVTILDGVRGPPARTFMEPEA